MVIKVFECTATRPDSRLPFWQNWLATGYQLVIKPWDIALPGKTTEGQENG